jgi:hypothetical protein
MDMYPARQVALINELYNINDALEVRDNLFFELFGIRKIVLEDMSIDDMVGESAAQRFQFKAVSDNDFFAEINERNQFLS